MSNSNFKIEPTSEEINIIQDMVNESYSYTAIGKKINMNGKTVKKIIENYNINTSKYSERVAVGRGKKKFLSEDDLELIKKLISEGVSVKKIVNNFSISRPTLERILKENNIETKYKRELSTKFTLNSEELNKVNEMLKEKISITNISKEFNVNRNTFSSYLKEIGVYGKSIDLDPGIINFINKMDSNYMTINNIYIITGIEKNIIRKNILNPVSEKLKYRLGSDINSTLGIRTSLRELNELKKLKYISDDDVDYFLKNIRTKKFIDIVKHLKIDHKHFRNFLVSIGYKEELTANFITKETAYSSEFINDLSNTAFSSSQIGMIYGMSYNTVSVIRRREFPNLKTYYNSNISRTTFEMSMELLLDKLEIAYIREYLLDGVKYDYYLGHRMLIEADGDFWHSDERNNNDLSKNEIANKNNFKLLRIKESDLKDNINNVSKDILNMYISSFEEHYKTH